MNRILAVAPLALFLAAGASADVFPTPAATNQNTIPFGQNAVYHQVFVSSLFSNATAGQPALITRIALAPMNAIRYKAGVTVRLGYTAAAPGGLVAPPSNVGGGGAPNAIVPPGMTDFFVAPSYLGTFTNVSASNFQMVFDGAPFVYDPSLGNLLVEIVVANPSHDSMSVSTTSATTESSRAYNVNGTQGTTATVAIRMDFAISAHINGATGACCASDGSCSTATLEDCRAGGGKYRGDNVSCGSTPCALPGACCQSDGSCTVIQQAACVANAGVFNGAGVACGAVSCAQVGACCTSTGSCSTSLAADCTALGASWKPDACGVAVCSKALISPIPTCTFPVICNSSSAATSVNSSLYINLTAGPNSNLSVRRIDFNSNASAGTAIAMTLYKRDGSYIGFDGSTDGWTSLGVFNLQSNGTSSTNPPVHLDLPTPVVIPQGQTVGLCLVAGNGGLRYRTSAANVTDGDLTIYSDVSRTPAFTGAPTLRGLTGCVIYDVIPGVACYPNCDGSTATPQLTANDFQCFLNRFAAAESYANCDGSTATPVLTANDFQCFLNAYAAGCS